MLSRDLVKLFRDVLFFERAKFGFEFNIIVCDREMSIRGEVSVDIGS